MGSRILAFSCLVLFYACEEAPPIDFFKEDVTIEIVNGRAKVTGVYYFRNLTNIGKRIRFYYPFPVDSNHHFPDVISIDFPYTKDSAGIYFSLSMRPNSVGSFKVVYEQRIERPYFKYITTTTKLWKRPIKEARFTVVVPETLSISANYAFTEPKRIDENLCYCIPVNNFFPVEDLIISW